MDFTAALQKAVVSVKDKLEPFIKNNKASSHIFFHEAIASAARLQSYGPQLFAHTPLDIGRTRSNCYVLLHEVRKGAKRVAGQHVGPS